MLGWSILEDRKGSAPEEEKAGAGRRYSPGDAGKAAALGRGVSGLRELDKTVLRRRGPRGLHGSFLADGDSGCALAILSRSAIVMGHQSGASFGHRGDVAARVDGVLGCELGEF